MLVNAALCGVTGALGTAIGPPMQQINRNLTSDLRKRIEKTIEPVVDKAGPVGLLAIGTVGGAVSMAPMAVLGYYMFGAPGAAVPLVLGGGAMAATMLRARHAAHQKPQEQPQIRTRSVFEQEVGNLTGSCYQARFCRIPTAVQTPQDFDALIATGLAVTRQ